MRPVRWLCALALGAIACGGDDQPPRPESAVDCAAAEGLELEVIDDFEGPPVERAASGWFFNNDGTAPSEQMPGMPPPVYAIPGGRCGSLSGVRVSGGPFKDYGGGLYHGLSGPLDASAWEGIAFWARRAPESNAAIRLDVSDANTDDTANANGQNPEGCTPNAPEGGPALGCDKFGAYVLIDPNWRFYAVEFDEMRQAGWGKPQEAFATDRLYSINFNFAHGYWDFSIDDVAFFRRRR